MRHSNDHEQDEMMKPGRPDQPGDIDDFARALLDKKVELALFPEEDDVTSELVQDSMNEEQRRQAEDTMLSALDQMRRSRGQMTIEEEEAYYRRKNPPRLKKKKENLSEDSSSSGNAGSKSAKKESGSARTGKLESADSVSDGTSQFEKMQNHRTAEKAEQKNLLESLDRRNPVRYEKSSREDHFEKAETRPVHEKKSQKKNRKKNAEAENNTGRVNRAEEADRNQTDDREQRLFENFTDPAERISHQKNLKIWIAAAVVLALCLFGGYVWKVSVYNPAHYLSEEKQSLYDWLVAYADEYPMMSDAEKNELLSRNGQLDILPASKLDELQAYFLEHTGSDLSGLIEILETQRQGELEEPQFLELLQYVEHFGSYDDQERSRLPEKKAAYQALSDLQKERIDQAMKQAVDLTFDQAVSEQEEKADQVIQEQIDGLEAEMQSLQKDRDKYVDFIQSEGKEASSDQVLAEYDSRIAAMNQQIETLRSQLTGSQENSPKNQD